MTRRDPQTQTDRSRRADRTRPRPPVERDGRLLEPVGLAMATALVALLVGGLLNANGMHKNASIQPDSPARDIAMSLTQGLVDITGALGLSEPRHLIAGLVGNGSKDDVVATVGLTPVKRHAPTPPVKQAFSPANKLQLYAGGDSLSLETAAALSAAAPSTRVIQMAEPDGHLNTGLERPDVLNWFERAKEVQATVKPNVSVLIFGGNDNADYMTGGANGDFSKPFGSPAWEREYRRRVALMMDTMTQTRGQTLIWVGAPVAQDPALDAQMKVLNRIYRLEAAKRAGQVTYLDPDPIFAPAGKFQTSITYQGKQVVVREPDGQHLNTDGGVVLADVILKMLEKRFSLREASPLPPITTGG